MLFKKDDWPIQRIKELYPEVTESETELIADDYKSGMRKEFDVMRALRSALRIFIVVIPCVTAEAIFSSYFLKPGGIADKVSGSLIIGCIVLFGQTPLGRKYYGREQEKYLAALVEKYRSGKRNEHGAGGEAV